MTKRQRFRNVPKDKVTGAEVRAVTDISNETNRAPPKVVVNEDGERTYVWSGQSGAPPEVVAEQATAAPMKDQGDNIADGITKHGGDFITGVSAMAVEPYNALTGKETPIEKKALTSIAWDTATGATSPDQGWGEFWNRTTERPAQVAGEAASYAIPFGIATKAVGTVVTKAVPPAIKAGTALVKPATKVLPERDYLPDRPPEKFVKNIEDGAEVFGPAKVKDMKLDDSIYYQIAKDKALTKKEIAFMRTYSEKPPGWQGPPTKIEFIKAIPGQNVLSKFNKVGDKPNKKKKPDTIGQGFSESDMYGPGSFTKDSYKGWWPWG